MNSENKNHYEDFTLEESYYFKGSSNYNITIRKDVQNGLIHVYSSYNECMFTCTSVKELGKFLVDLCNDKFA